MQKNCVKRERVLFICIILALSIYSKALFGADHTTELINSSFYQELSISGTVTSDAGIPIPGVTVKISGYSKGTLTDQDGSYTITVQSGESLEYAYLGFQSQIIKIIDQTLVNVQLKESVTDLDAVTVNAGYYKVSERERTGNISSITSREIEKQPVSNALQALQGRLPGINITQNTGVPGGGYLVNIRGLNSISSGNDPFYIIDGVPFISESIILLGNEVISGANPLSTIHPDDIESIEVLKDADATAIYGSRGANGVILITTKKGRTDGVHFEVRSMTGIGNVPRKVSLLTTSQYIEMRREAFENDGVVPDGINAPDLTLWDQEKDIDWQEKLLGGNAYTHDIRTSISGGNKNSQFSVRGNYYDESTVYPGEKGYDRWSVNSAINHRSDDNRFQFSASSLFSRETNTLPYIDVTREALTLPPNAPDFLNEDGTLNFYTDVSNPFVYLKQPYKSITKNLLLNSQVSYELLPGLSLKTGIGYNLLNRDEIQSRPGSTIDPSSTTQPSSRFGKVTSESWIFEPQLQFVKEFQSLRLDLLLGSTFQERTNELQELQATGFSNDHFLNNPSAAAELSISNYDHNQYRYTALFGRINFKWRDRYLLNITGRRDGSSRFGPDKQFANFGAVGMAWIFSKESFLNENLDFISFGKLRGSFGVTGNDQIGDYEYLDSYSPTTYAYNGISGLYPSRLFNPVYGWERNRKLEVALELGFLEDRILLNSAYYRNRSDNQLVGIPLPGSTGFSTIRANLPAEIENTGLEFDLKVTLLHGGKFYWNSGFNISFPKTELLKYPGLESSSFANIYEEGQSLYIKRKIHLTGVNPETGVYDFEDVDGDGMIFAPNDLQSIYELSQDYYGGFANSFQWGNWNLDLLFQFVKQTGVKYAHYLAPGFLYNQPSFVLDRWQHSGDVTEVQRFTQSYTDAGYAYSTAQVQSDYIYEDASFIRWKNVNLSYRLSVKGAKISDIRLYFQGQNLLTITKYKGLDPENQGFRLPPLRRFVFGIEIKI
ncbi:SusC/RagA family TonB-linked outer membrane protein [Robertkochia solimangrovi]|uniref:SusC/RagA family TonB-linked outer membrane protein n=1 Tax=Robertkochia solimangrovi TaxID=2213046 RepID=UPI00117D43B7|nr:SusC/RagA family TonB-linked outer membrane protein [Robertkochia solimangrovi]TRZ46093.1 SusC/RagA family TonB-linked outer membrane protein [Robertkochia solimangrovi]